LAFDSTTHAVIFQVVALASEMELMPVLTEGLETGSMDSGEMEGMMTKKVVMEMEGMMTKTVGMKMEGMMTKTVGMKMEVKALLIGMGEKMALTQRVEMKVGQKTGWVEKVVVEEVQVVENMMADICLDIWVPCIVQ